MLRKTEGPPQGQVSTQEKWTVAVRLAAAAPLIEFALDMGDIITHERRIFLPELRELRCAASPLTALARPELRLSPRCRAGRDLQLPYAFGFPHITRRAQNPMASDEGSHLACTRGSSIRRWENAEVGT